MNSAGPEQRLRFWFPSHYFLQVPALESVEQGGVSNPTEAAIIHQLLWLLIKVFPSQLRILLKSFYSNGTI